MSTPLSRSSANVARASGVVKIAARPVAPLVTSSRTCSAVASSWAGGPGTSSRSSRAGSPGALAGRQPVQPQARAVGLAGDVDGEPAHEAHVDVGVDLEAELADVEVQRLVLVEDEDR